MQTYSATNGIRQTVPAAVAMRGAAALSRQESPKRLSGTRIVLARGDELFAENDDADFFYKVLSGTIRTYKLLSDGRRQIDAFHLAGDIFGLEPGATHRFSAEAVERCEVIAFRRCGFTTLAADDPALGDQLMSSMMVNLERAHDHMLLLGRKTAQEKIATFLLDMARRVSSSDSFELPMQRSDIADHLGLTIETVSRTLTQLAKDGIIKLASASRSVVLCDKAALQRLNA
ncbi:MAG: helix-turn-helix domain-containing protein [Alphaproteobacteria bacterium]|nr:helix-turn-helix domain-containing protein [Alphaproteobacteria bacterium]